MPVSWDIILQEPFLKEQFFFHKNYMFRRKLPLRPFQLWEGEVKKGVSHRSPTKDLLSQPPLMSLPQQVLFLPTSP